jgi:hypothetical protein
MSEIFSNAVMEKLHSLKRRLLLERFPMLSNCPTDYYLSLFNYIDRIPESIFSEEIFHLYLSWLESQHEINSIRIRDYLVKKEDGLNKAFLFLGEINRYSWHDSFEETDDYERIRFIDQQIHPTYLRLIEAIFYSFTHALAFLSRIDRGKGTEGLDLFNTTEEIKNTGFSGLADLYNNTIRNGIAHGGIAYIEKEIRYRDDKGNEEVLSDNEIIRLVDDLVDACNGTALALKIFLFSHINDGYILPKQMLLEQLQAETDTPWWHIVGCVPSRLASQNQLIVYARPDSRDYYKVLYSTFLSGVLAEYFAPGYHRYFFSLRGPKALPGWAAFDGRRLLEIRNKGTRVLTDYRDALENNLVFYTPKLRLPRFLGKLDTFIQSFRIHWPMVLSDLREKIGRPDICARTSEIYRSGWGYGLKGSVVIPAVREPHGQDLIRANCGRIIRAVLSDARRSISLTDITHYLPLRYARISIFRQNYRKRRLRSFGLGVDLVATVQVKRLAKIRAPDIIGSQIEIKGRYRIAWNGKWIAQNRDP